MTTSGQKLRERRRPQKRRHHGRKRRGVMQQATGAKDLFHPGRGKAESETDCLGPGTFGRHGRTTPSVTVGGAKKAAGVEGRNL